MPSSLNEQFCGEIARLRQDLSLVTTNLHEGCFGEPAPTEGLPEYGVLTPTELRVARTTIAAATAHVPITREMAWTVPHLLKHARLIAPGARSASDVLRTLIHKPELDEQFVMAFTESGFLSCDRVIGRASWKYSITEMMAKQAQGSGLEVLAHCGVMLSRHRLKQPLDWDAVLTDLRTLCAWFPELRTLELMQQLYTRLHALHVRSVQIAQCWCDWRLWRAGHAAGAI
jgi:hypothetical protein